MLRKATKQLSAIALSAVMLLSALPVSACNMPSNYSGETIVEKDLQSKIAPELLSKLDNINDGDKLAVLISFNYPEGIAKKFADEIFARTGLTALDTVECSEDEYRTALDSMSDEEKKEFEGMTPGEMERIITNRIIAQKSKRFSEAQNQVRTEFFDKYNKESFNSLGLEASLEEVKSWFNTEPCCIVELSASDIEKAAASDIVQGILLPNYANTDDEGENVIISDKVKDLMEENPDGNINVKICLKSTDISKSVPNAAMNYVTGCAYLMDIIAYKPLRDYNAYGNNREIEGSLYATLPVDVLKGITENNADIIESISLWKPDSEVLPDTNYDFKYTSEDSLKILRASIGLEEKDWTVRGDINQDRKIDSLDALIALRNSVGLVSVSYNINRLYPIYDVDYQGAPEHIY